jgi:predicted glycoside hydrolase/deacetylase ChbG (UPF0249 family)
MDGPITRLIINADDLGMNQDVNNAIFELIDLGLVTSSTILANGPAFRDAADRVHDHPSASYGVHLNITQFKPLTDNPKLTPLLDDSGCFHMGWRSVHITYSIAEAVLEEWIAQFERARIAGIPVTHIDSHHYVHSSRPMLRVLKSFQRRMRVSRIRSKPNLNTNGRSLKQRFDSLKCRVWRYIVQVGNNTYMPDYLGKFSLVNELYEREKLPPGCLVEAIVHPAHPRFDAENNVLRNARDLRLFRECKLVSFEAVKPSIS